MDIFKDKTEKLMRRIAKLEPAEFLGVCKILGIKLYREKADMGETTDTATDNVEVNVEETVEGADPKTDLKDMYEPRPFDELWNDMCEKVNGLNRTRKRNLDKLLRAATKKEK